MGREYYDKIWFFIFYFGLGGNKNGWVMERPKRWMAKIWWLVELLILKKKTIERRHVLKSWISNLNVYSCSNWSGGPVSALFGFKARELLWLWKRNRLNDETIRFSYKIWLFVILKFWKIKDEMMKLYIRYRKLTLHSKYSKIKNKYWLIQQTIMSFSLTMQ